MTDKTRYPGFSRTNPANVLLARAVWCVMVQEHSGIEIDAPLDLVSALGLVTALTYSVTILTSTVHAQNLCIAASSCHDSSES